MKSANLNSKILEGYLKLFQTLSPKLKSALVSKLTKALNPEKPQHPRSIEKAFGAWKGDESAEELISSIQNSRHFDRQIESL